MDSSKHVFLCTAGCVVSHSNMLLALCNCPNSSKSEDLVPLRRAIDMNLKKGWVLHSDVPDLQIDFQFPLVHWACVLGKSRILEWLLSKQSFEAGVTKAETGETGLHRVVACFYNIQKKTKENVVRRASKFGQVVTVLTDRDPDVLFKTEKRGYTALHYCVDYAICSEMTAKQRAFFHHCFTFLLQRVDVLVKQKKLATDSLRDILGAQNTDGDTVFHILARSNASSKVIKQVLFDYKGSISARVKNNKGQTPEDVAVKFKSDLLVTDFQAFLGNGAMDPVDYEELTQETNSEERTTEGDETRVSDSLRNAEGPSEEIPLPPRRTINLRANIEFDRTAISPVNLRTSLQSVEKEKYFQAPDLQSTPVRAVPVMADPFFQRTICCPTLAVVSRTIPAVTEDVIQSLPAHDISGTSHQCTPHGDLERTCHDEGLLEDNKCCVQVAVQAMATCPVDISARESGVLAAAFPDISSPQERTDENRNMLSHNVVSHVGQSEEDGLGAPASSILSLEHSLDVASLLQKKLEQIRAVAEELRGELGDTESREQGAGCELRLLESDLHEVKIVRETHEKKKRELLEEINRKEKEILERENSIKNQIQYKERAVVDLKCQAGALTKEVERLKRKCNSYMDVLDDCTVAEDSPPRKRLQTF